MLIDQTNLKYLTAKYLFSNTPMYLYQHYRRNVSLQNLAIKNKPETLAEEFKRITSKETKSLEETVTAYSILMSFTFLDYGKAFELLNSLAVSKLEWGTELKDIYNANKKVWNILRLTPVPLKFRQEQIKSQSSTNIVTLGTKPKKKEVS